jgi:hypothetical protein
MFYISCLQPTGVSPALNNGRRASVVSQQQPLAKKKPPTIRKEEEEVSACQYTFLLDKPGCMDARMDEDEPCDASLECPLEPFDISKCLKRHKGVLKVGVDHAVKFTQRAENLFVSPLPGSSIYLDDDIGRRCLSLEIREFRVRFNRRGILSFALGHGSGLLEIKVPLCCDTHTLTHKNKKKYTNSRATRRAFSLHFAALGDAKTRWDGERKASVHSRDDGCTITHLLLSHLALSLF